MEVSDVQATTKTDSIKGVEKNQAPQKVQLTDGICVSKEAKFRAELVEQLKAMPEMRPHAMAAAERSVSLAVLAEAIANSET